MQAVLISIQPKWCELIASGKKTVEVRKTKPKIETPFKCYIYATKPRHFFKISKHLLISDESLFLVNGKVKMCEGFGVEYEDPDYKHLNYKVIGEFVCDEIKEITADNLVAVYFNNPQESTCLNDLEMRRYADGKSLFLWHISDLVIYDKPKELKEFKPYNRTEDDCKFSNLGYAIPKCEDCHECYVKRPPQSWCYVEVLKGE